MRRCHAGWGSFGIALGFVTGMLVGIIHEWSFAEAAPESHKPAQDLAVPGRINVGQGVFLPDFKLGPGGVLEWPNKLRISHGGGEESGLPPLNGLVRAQPGGNIVLQPQGNYMRSAIDLLPARGKQADLDAIGEFTIHRVQPTAVTQEMISYSALARKQDIYAVVVEAHGEGKLKPLVFMTVQGGLRDPAKAFSAEAMRMTEDGRMVFGLHRQGGRRQRPVDSITIEQPQPTKTGTYDSDAIKWVGKAHDGVAVHSANWTAQVHINKPTGESRLSFQSHVDDRAEMVRLEVTDRGELELPSAGGAVILRSPNGVRWRVAIADSGQLQVRPME